MLPENQYYCKGNQPPEIMDYKYGRTFNKKFISRYWHTFLNVGNKEEYHVCNVKNKITILIYISNPEIGRINLYKHSHMT